MKVYSENKKAFYDYEILEKFQAGLVLLGQEVKSIRQSRISLDSSYVVFNSRQEPLLVGSKVPAYQPKNITGEYDSSRSRPLLLTQKEINYLSGRTKEKGFALIPLKIFDKSGRIKLEFALARGKKKYSKKEKLKKRDMEREVNRELSGK